MSKEIDTPVPEFLGSDDVGSTFVDNSTTINKTFVKSSSGRSRQSRYAAGGLSLIRIAAFILLIAMLFSFVITGSVDGWNFQRLLHLLQDAPDIATPLMNLVRKGIDLVSFPSGSGIISTAVYAVLNFLWSLIGPLISVTAFCGAALIQTVVFVQYFAFALLLG